MSQLIAILHRHKLLDVCQPMREVRCSASPWLRLVTEVFLRLLLQDQITLEELNVLDRLPHYCPVCGEHS